MLNLLPIIAPILAKVGENSQLLDRISKIIYFIYSFTCHQFAYRSLVLFDYQYAWCARDTGIWLGMLLPAILVTKVKGIKWYWVLPFLVPIALDGGIQTVATLIGVQPTGVVGDAWYVSNNLMRFMTGALFGIGISLWISPFMHEALMVVKKQEDRKDNEILKVHGELVESVALPFDKLRVTFQTWAAPVTKLLGIMFVIYFGFVTLWNITSMKNKPSDILDTAVKLPAKDFYTRRAWGPCTAGIDDLVRASCLLRQ